MSAYHFDAQAFLSLDKLGGKHRIALVSNIDDDLLQATRFPAASISYVRLNGLAATSRMEPSSAI